MLDPNFLGFHEVVIYVFIEKNQIVFYIASDLNYLYFIGINLARSLSNK